MLRINPSVPHAMLNVSTPYYIDSLSTADLRLGDLPSCFVNYFTIKWTLIIRLLVKKFTNQDLIPTGWNQGPKIWYIPTKYVYVP